eukprot:TRINITY_DN23549_c0_g1_i2.p1 TRINITY_DN23549_c0_g1~~TRINITY_DN23549_c0_g1_i2.p1  ORF type:complete len:349 (-),score=98.92 TRINITY_DN23549_c0_g1_i2:303-1247(-)
MLRSLVGSEMCIRDSLESVLRSNIAVTEDQAKDAFVSMDKDGNGAVDYHEWLDSLDMHRLAESKSSVYMRTSFLSSAELDQLYNMTRRADLLGEYAAARKINLMVDAEQTYMQPAIDQQVLQMQRIHNKEEGYIYNTYQCYLRDAFPRVAVDFLRAEREGFKFAAKLVRGAYMFQERDRAKELGYKDPVHADLDATHRNYDAVVARLISMVPRTGCRLMIASHNEVSINKAVQLLREHQIENDVFFGQLLGMCDHVSYMLGSHGLKAYKYVPYGPVNEVMPYLIRRAEENSDMLGGATREIQLTWNELKRRHFG